MRAESFNISNPGRLTSLVHLPAFSTLRSYFTSTWIIDMLTFRIIFALDWDDFIRARARFQFKLGLCEKVFRELTDSAPRRYSQEIAPRRSSLSFRAARAPRRNRTNQKLLCAFLNVPRNEISCLMG